MNHSAPLQSAPVHWHAESIWQAVMVLAQERADARLAGFSVEVLPQIDSTNSELMRRARAGQFEPTLLVAEQQTAGRGRMGRAWESGQGPQAGSSLTFSLGLPLSPLAWDGLSLAVGVSVAQHVCAPSEALTQPLQPPIGLKWPNDLWWQGGKLAGVLIETCAMASGTGSSMSDAGARGDSDARYAVIGVGINIAAPPAQGLVTPPAWLQAIWPQASAAQVLQSLAPALLRDLLLFEAQGFVPFASQFVARDVLQGRRVVLSDGREGVAHGVDARCALRVETALGMECISSGEVSVRPVPALLPSQTAASES